MRAIFAAFAALSLAACASANDEDAPAGPPSLTIAPGQPAPAQARFYVDCITHSAAANTFDREANVIRFHCDGAPAQRFFDGLGAWSAQVRSEIADGDRLWRFSTPIRENPSFADFCTRTGAAATARYECTIVLNVGEFLGQ